MKPSKEGGEAVEDDEVAKVNEAEGTFMRMAIPPKSNLSLYID